MSLSNSQKFLINAMSGFWIKHQSKEVEKEAKQHAHIFSVSDKMRPTQKCLNLPSMLFVYSDNFTCAVEHACMSLNIFLPFFLGNGKNLIWKNLIRKNLFVHITFKLKILGT